MSRPPPVAGGGRRVSGSGRNFVSESRTENFGHRNRSSSSARAHECCSFASVRTNSLNRTARAIHDRPYIIHRTPPPKSAKNNAPSGTENVTLPSGTHWRNDNCPAEHALSAATRRNEMTLDYCFFCHDKKHFCVVKGHFCSFLVSSICWLTSLYAD